MQDPQEMTPEARLDFVEAIRQKVLRADSLRAAGEDSRADDAEPTPQELNAAVDTLRLIRASRVSGAKGTRKTAPAGPKLTLSDLIPGA